ncbi:MAG: AsmA family protein [Gammaproteobacteria bacterium]|nr:AsmA family protein [Gammaproteobacteria bacterium]
MKIIKYLIIALVILIVVFVAGAAILVATVDPNDHKDSIISAVKDATGRDLKLDGDIGFSFFPKLGVKLGQAEFSNAKGFGNEPFASVDKVGVSVDLLSLLKMKVQADTIELKGLRVNLQKNKNGKTNWDDLSSNSSNATDASASSSDSTDIGLEVAGIHITDSQVVYDDQQAGNKITLNPIELKTGSVGSGKPSKISVQLGLNQTNPPLTADIDLNTNARLNVSTAVYQLTDLVLAVDAQGDTLPNGELNLKVNSNVEANLKSESLKLDPIDISLADIALDGNLSVKSFSRPNIKFALHSDEIDLAKIVPASDSSAQPSSASTEEDAKIELPVDMLRSLNIDGSLNVGKLLASGLTMTDLVAKINGKGGVINLDPLTMNLYQGAYSGSAGLNVSGNTPSYSASSDLKNLAVEGLMADLSEDGKSIIRGKTEMTFKVTTSGDRPSTLTKRLNGNASFKAAEGALQSEKLAKNVERAIAFLKGREPKPAGEELVFDSLSGTFIIQNGVANNNDLKLITPLIYGNGKGDINIGESNLDYVMAIGLSDEPGKAAIPVTIRGPFEKPKYGIDLKAALGEKQKQVVEEKKEEIKEKVNDKVKDKLKGLKLF